MASNRADLINPSRIITSLAGSSDYAFESVYPLILRNDEIVTVEFFSNHPNVSDWIGAYSPANTDITASAPIKFGMCDQALNTSDSENQYLLTGRASLQFNLTNLRTDVGFHYFTGGLQTPILVASTSNSQTVQFVDKNQPLRNRIVPSGDPDVFYLIWNSDTSEVPMIKWGTQSGEYIYSAIASTTRIEKADVCGGVAAGIGWRDMGLMHRVNITGITTLNLSSRKLYYIFGDNQTNDFSDEWVFQVPPQAGVQPYEGNTHATSPSHATLTTKNSMRSIDTNPTTATVANSKPNSNIAVTDYTYPSRGTQVILMADLGVGASDDSTDTKVFSEACLPAFNTTNSIGYRVLQGEVDAVILSGDISYANGYLSNWEFFLDTLSPITGRTLFLTTVGNHESIWAGSDSLYQGIDSGGECGLSVDLIPMPAPASRQHPYWSYEIGLIHFVGMSTEHNYTINSPQYRFLEHDLRKVNRTRTPWVVFTGHRSAYVDSRFCCGWGVPFDSCGENCVPSSDVAVMATMQQHIDPLLYKYQVNLAFAGHFHNVQRQAAVFQGQVVQNSVPHTDEQNHTIHVQENPQATVWMVIGSAGNGPSISNKRFAWSEASWDNLYGYAMITADNCTHLSWQFINSANDEVVDRLLLTQNFSVWSRNQANNSNTGDTTNNTDLVGNYSSQAQLVVLLTGTLVLLLSLFGAFLHRLHTKKLLQQINNPHVLLDTTEHNDTNNSSITFNPANRVDENGQALPVFSIESLEEEEVV